MEDIAIVGFSFKLPQGRDDVSSLWSTLENKENLMTEWPAERLNLDGFYDETRRHPNRLYSRGAHFLSGDPGAFDAPFFSITTKEAAAMDPMHRWALEASYHAFENAGIPLSALRGSRTAVFGASMTDDYQKNVSKDPETMPRLNLAGNAMAILPNRISWTFDLAGPSVHVDTACSSSLVALDLACQSLRSGDATAALVTGANVILGPECSLLVSNLNFLSPASLCRSFDAKADGYARGEGVIAMLLKPVSQALADGDAIRAVIRATGSNQDGHTPVLTQPSLEAQERLIRHVYRKAGLDFARTRYVEAHGTGTAVGDPIEVKAIGRVFKTCRTNEDPLYIGSVKSSIGHSEGCSGLAGILKAILVLEKGVIPPQALFESINPDIDEAFYHIKIPTENISWPADGARRVSVNSFGFGGCNSHAILDDALNYLSERGLEANHATATKPAVRLTKGDGPNGHVNGHVNGHIKGHMDGVNGHVSGHTTGASPKLLLFSASDEKALTRTTAQHETYLSNNPSTDIDLLSYTLADRRSHLLYRTFSIVNEHQLTSSSPVSLPTEKPIRSSSSEMGIALVFTGQGAQYVNKGVDLLQYPVFQDTLRRVDEVYGGLGCAWSVFDELHNEDNINLPQYSQPLSTAIQLGLVHLLRSFNVSYKAVVGHSSGEIAAAYAIGALSLESACKVSFHRGQLAGQLRSSSSSNAGAMMSVNLPRDQVGDYIRRVLPSSTSFIVVACINSPANCTLSGPETALDTLKEQLEDDGIFAQKLKTGVAYHSPSMSEITDLYLARMGKLSAGDEITESCPMISSVTGDVIEAPTLRNPQYWVDNMVSPVEFSKAVGVLAAQTPSDKIKLGMDGAITDVVEVGPHSALKRPILDTLTAATTTDKKKQQMQIRYHPTLQRTKPASLSVLTLVGTIFCHGHAVSVSAANLQSQELRGKHRRFLVDLPEYPFDHSRIYWQESRMSRDYRLRKSVQGDFLGVPSQDWNHLEPRWRSFLSTETVPWTRDHVVNDTILFPATGMLVMAMEAVQQMAAPQRSVLGYHIKTAEIKSPIIVKDATEERTEVVLQLRPVHNGAYEKEAVWFDISIFSWSGTQFTECFTSRIQIQYEATGSTEVDNGLERRLAAESVMTKYRQADETCTVSISPDTFYKDSAEHGIQYGEWFQLLNDLRWNGDCTGIATIDVSNGKHTTKSIVHPAILDAALQSLRATATKGLTDSSSTYVPTHIHDAWFSASGWQSPDTSTVRYVTTTTGSGTEGSIHALGDDGMVLCSVNKLVCARVADHDTEQSDDELHRKLLYGIDWKPQLSLLEPSQLQEVCDANVFRRDETAWITRFRKLKDVLDTVLCKTLARLTDADRQKLTVDFGRYVAWMEHSVSQLSDSQARTTVSDEDLAAQLDEVESLYPTWRIFSDISRHLRSILVGETDPLELVFGQGLAEGFYADIFQTTCDDRFTRLLDLASHENPNLRILEVGAGTGGVTKYVLSALGALEDATGSMRFSEYTYTDISPSFFENASIRWAAFKNRMSFKAFDLSKTGPEQGFEAGSYDIVIAGSVLHATSDLTKTVQIVREMLKPGGRLVAPEATAPDNIATNFASGILPGWWFAQEEWRSLSPCITEDHWDVLLKEVGFTGLDMCIRDFDSTDPHLISVLVATAQAPVQEPVKLPSPLAYLLVDEESDRQIRMARVLQTGLRELNQQKAQLITLQGLQNIDLSAKDLVVCLLEIDGPILDAISEQRFSELQTMVKEMHNLLWVNMASIEDSKYPHYSIMKGFLRTVSSESRDKNIVSLSIESNEESPVGYVSDVSKVFKAAFQSGSPEIEYVVRDGLVMTGRAAREREQDEQLMSLLSPNLSTKPWLPGPALELTVGNAGLLDTLEFVEDIASQSDLLPDEIEIESKAWGLGFRHVLQALGRLNDREYGSDCAGIVTRVGTSCDGSIKPGDRVCMSSLGCMRTYPRAHARAVVKLPNSVSFEDAASIIMPGSTAYYALIDVARLRKGEKILIHSATGSTGQMAIWIAKMQGAEIFATVGFDEKKKLLVEEFGIPEDHIFYSRNTSFAQGIMRVTEGYGVDVVLNSLSGDSLRASWECVAPFGRFVELGRADIDSNATLPMACFAKNVSFAAVDLHHIMSRDPELESRLLTKVLALAVDGVIGFPRPVHIYPVSQIEQAFRYMQGGTNTGRIVISVNRSDMVPRRVLERPSWRLDEDASYLVAGGLGGLGRAILLWMADQGAKHLIVPSRSGASSRAAYDVVSQLRERGVNIVTPKCDVSSSSSVAGMLHECAQTLPPVKGCINAAMVLQDAVFDNMTHAQWELTINSKVHSTWNLHQLLPENLDFFICLSSICGIMGSMGQSNYAAGCTFQDAIARYRVARGQKAVSIDVGWIRDMGIISEREVYQAHRRNARDLRELDGVALIALLSIYCGTSLPLLSLPKSQVLIGLATPADYLIKGESVPIILNRPLLAAFSQITGDAAGQTVGDVAVDPAVLFSKAGDKAERSEVVRGALATKLARAISISPDDVDASKPLSEYGVDSLMAVELRNWIGKDFHASVAVFDILGGTPISAIADLVAERSTVGGSAKKA